MVTDDSMREQDQPTSNNTVCILNLSEPLSGRNNAERPIIEMKPFMTVYETEMTPYTVIRLFKVE